MISTPYGVENFLPQKFFQSFYNVILSFSGKWKWIWPRQRTKNKSKAF